MVKGPKLQYGNLGPNLEQIALGLSYGRRRASTYTPQSLVP